MELRTWNFSTDNHYIPSFLDGMSIAHHEPRRTEDWFHWKFEQSPYGPAILACAFEDDKVAGCVAFGKGKIKYRGEIRSCALSYETFVHPDFQGRGLFKKLIKLVEAELLKEKVEFLYNFPNSNSLPGFSHMGWIIRNDLKSYKIHIARPVASILNIRDIKKAFVPLNSNFTDILNTDLSKVIVDASIDDIVRPIWTKEYLKWRFFSFPNRNYHVINTDDYFAISMIGNRGKLKDAHLLYAVSKNANEKASLYIPKILSQIKKEVKPHIITYSSTICDDLLDNVGGFWKVPSHSNFCYKVLDESLTIEDLRIVLPSINAHTY